MNGCNSYDIAIRKKEEKGGEVSTPGSLAYSKQRNGFPLFFSFFPFFFLFLPPAEEAIF